MFLFQSVFSYFETTKSSIVEKKTPFSFDWVSASCMLPKQVLINPVFDLGNKHLMVFTSKDAVWSLPMLGLQSVQ